MDIVPQDRAALNGVPNEASRYLRGIAVPGPERGQSHCRFTPYFVLIYPFKSGDNARDRHLVIGKTLAAAAAQSGQRQILNRRHHTGEFLDPLLDRFFHASPVSCNSHLWQDLASNNHAVPNPKRANPRPGFYPENMSNRIGARDANVIGRSVVKFRYQRGWTQDELVGKLQLLGCYMTRDILANIETQRGPATDKQLEFFAQVFGAKEADFFPPKRHFSGRVVGLAMRIVTRRRCSRRRRRRRAARTPLALPPRT